MLQIEIFNTGIPPCPQDMGDIFVPFYSSKPYGTGFGLVIGIALVLFLEHLLLRKGGAKATS